MPLRGLPPILLEGSRLCYCHLALQEFLRVAPRALRQGLWAPVGAVPISPQKKASWSGWGCDWLPLPPFPNCCLPPTSPFPAICQASPQLAEGPAVAAPRPRGDTPLEGPLSFPGGFMCVLGSFRELHEHSCGSSSRCDGAEEGLWALKLEWEGHTLSPR